MKTIQSLHSCVAARGTAAHLIIAAALLVGLLPVLGACKADFSSDADALFLSRVMNSGLDISSLDNRISPAPELQEFVAKPGTLLKAAAAPDSSVPPTGVRLHAVLEDDEIIPWRIYPAGAHIQLHAMAQTRDYILLHYRGGAIDCPLVIISKGDYRLSCGFSAADYLAEFGVVYPGSPGFREKHPFVLGSVLQYDGQLLMIVGGRPYRIAFGEKPRSRGTEPAAEILEAPALADARVNRMGDTLRLFKDHGPRLVDNISGGVDDFFAPPSADEPGEFRIAYNPADDSFLAMALHFRETPPAFVNWKRRRGIPVRRRVCLRGILDPETRFTAHTRCGRAGHIFLMGDAGANPVLVRVGSRRGRIRAAAASADFPGAPVLMACGGNRLFARFVNEDAGTEAIHRFNLRGGGRREVFAGEDYSISDLAPLSGSVLLFIAHRPNDGEAFLGRAERRGGWQTTLREIPGDVRAVLPLYNMSEPRMTSGLPATSSRPVFRR